MQPQNFKSVENQVFAVTAGKEYKSMLLTPEAILLCSKTFKSAEEFRKSFDEASNKTLTFISTLKIPYISLVRASTQTGSEDTLRLKYEGMKLTWPDEIELSNGKTDAESVLNYLQYEHAYRRSEIQVSTFKAVLPNLGYIAVCVVLSWVLFSMSNGEMESAGATRRNRMKIALFRDLAETLGPTGSLLAGIAATAIAVWFFWQKYNNPPVETRLER